MTAPSPLFQAASAYRAAELACAAHKARCMACDQGNDCTAGSRLWLAEMRARKAMWDALDAMSAAEQAGNTHRGIEGMEA